MCYTLGPPLDQPDQLPYSVVENPLGHTVNCLHPLVDNAHGVCESTGAQIEEAAHQSRQEVAISY